MDLYLISLAKRYRAASKLVPKGVASCLLILQNRNIQISAPSLKYFEQQSMSRDECIITAFNSGGFSMVEIGNHFGLHYSRVSRMIKNNRLNMTRDF